MGTGEAYTALAVEDDAATLQLIREHLTRSGFRVWAVASGWEALKRIKDGPVDVVIAEFTISDMDGCSLREKFLVDPSLRDIPFVFLIPEGETEKSVRVLRNGVDDCITKPVDPVALVARVQALIERRRAYQEMIRVDPVTRLINRTEVERRIIEELARLERYDRFASMALVDVDDFDRFNSEFDQATGDLLLTCLSGVILANIRHVDIAGRRRSDKLLFYLPETSKEGADTLLWRLLDQFGEVTDAMLGVKVTFSAGVVEAPAHGTEFAALLTRAQEAVRHAKQEGKARVVTWSEDLAADRAS